MENSNKTLQRLAAMIANFQQKKEKLKIFILEEARLVITHLKL
jgi:hypothetical protein